MADRKMWEAPDIVPAITYSDVPCAVEWLERVFGFRERVNARLNWSGGSLAWIEVGDSLFSITTPDETWPKTPQATPSTFMMKVYVDDIDKHFARAKSEGVTIVSDCIYCESTIHKYLEGGNSMKISKRLLALSLFFACFLNGLLGQAAFAYKCRERGSPRQELERATAVFIGKVTKVYDKGSVWINEFEVEKTWKGAKTKHLVVHSGRHIYRYRFQEGGKYLVYAYGKDELTTSRCGRTTSLASAKADLKELGEGTKITSSVWDAIPPGKGPTVCLCWWDGSFVTG
jgi:uncharacterized glyoxalase superfamily protein PhnB